MQRSPTTDTNGISDREKDSFNEDGPNAAGDDEARDSDKGFGRYNHEPWDWKLKTGNDEVEADDDDGENESSIVGETTNNNNKVEEDVGAEIENEVTEKEAAEDDDCNQEAVDDDPRLSPASEKAAKNAKASGTALPMNNHVQSGPTERIVA